MGIFDRLFGTDDTYQQQPPQRTGTRPAGRSDDEIAVERYRYLLRTAPPETIEQVHTEAFAKLTQEQRNLLFQQLSDSAPQGEAPRDAAPSSLAAAATRQELRNPGTMERSLGGGGGMGFGSMVASSLLGTVAGYVIGSALVSAFLPNDMGGSADAEGADSGSDAGADSGADTGGDSGGDFGGGDFGGGDFGGDFGF